MSWSAIERRAQTWLCPRWLQGLLVRTMRQHFSAAARHETTKTSTRLYLDLSVIARHDAGTGIQRIVRSVAMSLVNEPHNGLEVIPIAATRNKGYQPISWPGQSTVPNNSPSASRRNDVFLGLDFALDTIHWHRRQLMQMKQQGMRFWFVMYDLLPEQKPEWFSDKLVVRYRRWLQTIAGLADGFFCISPTVADDLRRYLADHLKLREQQMPQLAILPMGWDIRHAPNSTGVSSQMETLLHVMQSHPTALMVGTLEPRKGHADVLAAFDRLWQAGHAYQLVIAGRPGWKTESLQQTLRNHPFCNERIFWRSDATDEEIEHLYAACTGVIVASYAEGFGLPLIEALGHGKPVLARDIPVFHTLNTEAISYFPANPSAAELAGCIAGWLQRIEEKPKAIFIPELSSWRDTANRLLTTLRECRR